MASWAHIDLRSRSVTQVLTKITDAGAKTHGDSPTSSSGQSTPSFEQSTGSKEGQTPTSSDTTGRKQSKNSASPKFNTVPENSDSEDVKKHNEDVDRRRANSGAGEKDQNVKRGTYSGELAMCFSMTYTMLGPYYDCETEADPICDVGQGGIAQGTGDGPK